MFDWYEPDPLPTCPECGADMKVCQGKDGPNAVLVWQQGLAYPTAQRADDPWLGEELERFSLPARFRFSCWCVNDHESVWDGSGQDGVWTSTHPAPLRAQVRAGDQSRTAPTCSLTR